MNGLLLIVGLFCAGWLLMMLGIIAALYIPDSWAPYGWVVVVALVVFAIYAEWRHRRSTP